MFAAKAVLLAVLPGLSALAQPAGRALPVGSNPRFAVPQAPVLAPASYPVPAQPLAAYPGPNATRLPGGARPGSGAGASFGALAVPTITSLTPSAGGVGSAVTINGTGFTGATDVTFNGLPIPYTVVSATTITIAVPMTAPLGQADIFVTTPDGTSNGVFYTVIVPVPTITSLSPAVGPFGTAVTITGTGFVGATAVVFNGTPAAYTIVNATTITTTVPVGAFTGNLVVTSSSGTSNGVLFTVGTPTPAPVLTSLAPTSGPVGTIVTITGTNLARASAVRLNGTSAPFLQTSITTINFTIPAGATTGNITVTTPGGTSNGLPFTVTVPAPVLTTLSPSRGPVGATVTITGTNVANATAVSLSGVSSAFTQTSPTTLTFVVPTGATTGNLVVTTPGGPSNGLLFTVTTGTATRSAAAARVFTVVPVPAAAGAPLHLTLAGPARAATATLHNVLGQAVATQSFLGDAAVLPTTGLAAGTYLLRVAVAGQAPVAQRVVLE